MKELNYEDWQKKPTPKEMWVWDDCEEDKRRRRVIYISKETYPVVSINLNAERIEHYKHCAEIEKQRRMTNKELSWWLSEKPHRELKIGNYIYHDYDYKENEQDAEVTDFLLIRENDGEWKEPFTEIEEV